MQLERPSGELRVVDRGLETSESCIEISYLHPARQAGRDEGSSTG